MSTKAYIAVAEIKRLNATVDELAAIIGRLKAERVGLQRELDSAHIEMRNMAELVEGHKTKYRDLEAECSRLGRVISGYKAKESRAPMRDVAALAANDKDLVA